MPLDGAFEDTEADVNLLGAIVRRYQALSESVVRLGGPERTVIRWLGRRGPIPEDFEDRALLFAMALDLDLFTPSASGRTAMDRYLAAAKPLDDLDARALDALRAARWRLVRIVDRADPDVVVVSDLVDQATLRVLDDSLSSLAAGASAVMRLCPLASGRQARISPLFALDAEGLATALGFVRPGKGLGDGYRCAAVVYRDCARRGVLPMPVIAEPDDHLAGEPEPTEVNLLAIRWSRETDPLAQEDLVADIRLAASIGNIVEALGAATASAPLAGAPAAAYEAISRLQIETFARRGAAGLRGYEDALAVIGETVTRCVATHRLPPAARRLFERLAAGLAGSASGDGDDLARVLGLIQALRERTVERGCSEAEAMAAAAKVAELLDRYDLTLDEIQVRRSDCEGVSVDSGRRRATEVDACINPVAAFCDCRVWTETGEDGQLRYIYFGLRADVQAARLLHEMVESAFETETVRFRRGETYRRLPPDHRRKALSSFRIGLADGINGKLDALRRGRGAGAGRGFDLVAVKRSVVDEEVERLGLDFTHRKVGGRRTVNAEAYRAGEAAGALFEPCATLDGRVGAGA